MSNEPSLEGATSAEADEVNAVDLSEIEFNSKISGEGVWLYPFGDDMAFRCRSFQDPRVKARYASCGRRFERAINAGGAAAARASDAADAEVLAEVIVLDWKNVRYEGKALPYSKEKAHELFSDPRFVRLREAVMAASRDAEQFRAGTNGAAEKNS